MEQLTLEDKEKIVEMLNKHYAIDPAATAIIKVAADNAAQVTELTLKAFSIIGKPKNDAMPHSDKPTTDDSSVAIVRIDEMSSKLQFIKAIREVTCWKLEDCNAFVDTIVRTTGGKTCAYTYMFIPFKVGADARITLEQWVNIVACNKDRDFKWHYEEATFETKA